MHVERLTLVLYAGFPTDNVTLEWFSFMLSVSEEALEGDSSSFSPLSRSTLTCDLTERTLSLISHSRVLPSSWLWSWERHMTAIHLPHIYWLAYALQKWAQTSRTNMFICNRSITANRCGVLQCYFLFVPCLWGRAALGKWFWAVPAAFWLVYGFLEQLFPQSAGPFGAVHALETSSS